MSIADFIMNRMGFKTESSESYDVQIQDGKMIGNPYSAFSTQKAQLSEAELAAAYEKISCVGTSIDLIASNMQMIEPVFWDDKDRTAIEYPSDVKLVSLRNRFEKPNSTDNRKSFISKSVKSYILYGVIFCAFVLDNKKQIISIKVLDYNCVTSSADISGGKVQEYTVSNMGFYDGRYSFNGAHYVKNTDSNTILSPYINSSAQYSYLPIS